MSIASNVLLAKDTRRRDAPPPMYCVECSRSMKVCVVHTGSICAAGQAVFKREL